MTTPPHSGIWSVAQLRSAGLSKAALSRRVAAGELLHVRRGYYARPDADPACVAAVRVGGRLTSSTALRRHECWVPPDARLHVALAANSSRLRLPPDPLLALHWTSTGPAHRLGGTFGHDVGTLPPLQAMADFLDEAPPPHAVAVMDSMLYKSIVAPASLRDAVCAMPHRIRSLLTLCDSRAESGLESIARVGLRSLGLAVEPQVPLAGYRLDLLVEGRIDVELDGREHHDDPDAFERDRRRDAVVASHGVQPLRFTFGQVMFGWDGVVAAVLGALGGGAFCGGALGGGTPALPHGRFQELRS
jgi:very-short-patch-repair endonuclease